MRVFARLLPILLALGGAPLSAGEAFRIFEVVAPGASVPGGEGTFDSTIPFSRIALDRGQVVFQGRSSDRTGIYWYRDGQLHLVADTETEIPGSPGTTFILLRSTAIDRGQVVFSSPQGIFADDGSGLRSVFLPGEMVPNSGEVLGGFGHVDLKGGELVFGAVGPVGAVGTHTGAVFGTTGGLQTLWDQSTPIPDGAGLFPAYNYLGFDDFGMAVTRPRFNSSVEEGIYKDVGQGLEKVADLDTPVPGGFGNFTDFNRMDYDRGSVAFLATGALDDRGVYTDSGGLRSLADTSTVDPGSGKPILGFSNSLSFSRGNAAFVGLSTEFILLARIGDELFEILREGDMLDGRRVRNFRVHRGGMDGTEVAFSADLVGGHGVYIAKLSFFDDGFESGDTSGWDATVSPP